MRAPLQTKPKTPSNPLPTLTPVRSGLLQRKCACGGTPGRSGECAECAKKKRGLQQKLAIGKSDDPMEQEAERIANQLWDSPAHSPASGQPLRIQRFTESRETQTAPGSVDRVLATPGRPLEPALRRDMEQRFGHDFSSVRVHSSAAAEQSAREVNADAYTVGCDVVFGAGQLRSATHAGRRLIAHELTHVVQQGSAAALGGVNQPAAKTDPAGISHLQPFPRVLQRQPAPAAPTNDAQKADASAAPTGDPQKAAAPAAAPALQWPTCQATAAADWIRDPQNPREELFGFTELSTTGTRPEILVGPASSGKGFVVLPTGASLAKPISMQYLQPGRYKERAIRLRLQEGGGPPGGYLRVWEITTDGSDAIKAGEQEHCDDFRFAFYFAYYRYAELVNEIAAKGTVFPTEAAAKAALKGTVFIEAAKLRDYFKCLAEEMRDRRDKAGWHTPRKTEPTLGYDSKLRDDVAVRTLSASSLPNVGKHSSGELFFQHAAPACVSHTTVPP